MKRFIYSFILLVYLTNSYAQLAQHYQYKEKGKTLNLQERMVQTQTPGMVFYIDSGTAKDSLAIGKKGPMEEEAMTMETLFPVGAISFFPLKMELLRMQAQGLVHLDDPVKQYIPELKDGRKKQSSPITIKDLLLAKFSLNGPYKPTGYGKRETRTSLEQLLKEGNKDFKNGIIVTDINKKQNLECTYAILCQIIIERIHQRPMEEVIQEYIFKPIGMSSSFYATELSNQQAAQAASGTIKGRALENAYKRYEALGAAGLWSTAKDISKLVRHVMNAAKGIDNRILSIEDATTGLTKQHGFCSLIFHVSDGGNIYGGGNSKGFYTCLEADLKTGLVQVIFANADLVWPLVNFSFGQTASYIEKKKSEKKMGLYVPEKSTPTIEKQIAIIQQIAQASNMSIELRTTADGVPKGITALPALVVETPNGNSLYGGLWNEPTAIQNFIRTSSFKAIPVRADTTFEGLYVKRNKQTIALPLKWTGTPALQDWNNAIQTELTTALNGQIGSAILYPMDRRIYLDIHPYEEGEMIYFSYAIFSQFNCSRPVYTNFGTPIQGLKMEQNQLIARLVKEVKQQLDYFLNRAGNGFTSIGVEENTRIDSTYLFGPTADTFNRTNTATETSISGKWTKVSSIAYDQPLVQFNFPAPLNRYAGEVKEMNGQVINEEGLLAGYFEVELNSLTMGMKELDTKVLKQYIKVKSNPTASFSFEKVPMNFNWNTTNRQKIAGTFNFMNKEIPLIVEATITPNALDQSLSIQVDFTIEIAKTFGMPMPDGPKDAASQLEFLINIKMQA